MPRNRECDFCGDDIEPGTGTMLVHKDGSTVYYCSSKCEKNADLGREPRDLSWTESGRAAGGPAVEETADEADEEAEPAADAAVDHDETDVEDQGQAVDAGDDAAPDLESVEDDEAVAGPEGEGEDEAAADPEADAEPETDADAETEDAADDDGDDEAEEEEAEA